MSILTIKTAIATTLVLGMIAAYADAQWLGWPYGYGGYAHVAAYAPFYGKRAAGFEPQPAVSASVSTGGAAPTPPTAENNGGGVVASANTHGDGGASASIQTAVGGASTAAPGATVSASASSGNRK